MEPLHTYLEYKKGKQVLAGFKEKEQLMGLSDNEKKEMKELSLRVSTFELFPAKLKQSPCTTSE